MCHNYFIIFGIGIPVWTVESLHFIPYSGKFSKGKNFEKVWICNSKLLFSKVRQVSEIHTKAIKIHIIYFRNNLRFSNFSKLKSFKNFRLYGIPYSSPLTRDTHRHVCSNTISHICKIVQTSD